MNPLRYVLDTDLFSLSRTGTDPLASRIRAVPVGGVGITVITVEEVLSGWYTALRQPARPARLEFVYEQLARSVLELSRLPIIIYTQAAMAEYDRLNKLKLNVRRNDLRIAAIALVNNAVVATRNVRDFSRVPGLVVEDWSAP